MDEAEARALLARLIEEQDRRSDAGTPLGVSSVETVYSRITIRRADEDPVVIESGDAEFAAGLRTKRDGKDEPPSG